MAPRFISYGIPILLAGMMLVQSTTLSLIQFNFLWNRDSIAALFCVNLDKPEMNCEGSCELGRRLEKAADTEQPQALQLPEFASWVFVFSSPFSLHIPFCSGTDGQVATCFLLPGKSRFSTDGIFHPPQS
ncbi:hypothetical protein [Cyclobacterium roseum]|uniref:hypothetical protein n=1 Tax=Cyclobacterium roseum TaxID=2666137 RepID=UPI001390C11B|nr:hypothetical protein [Cyclobacterium roseum]